MFKSIKFDFHKLPIKLLPYKFNIIPIRNKVLVKNISDNKNISVELLSSITEADKETREALEILEIIEAKIIINNNDNSGLDAYINNVKLYIDAAKASRKFSISYNKAKLLKARKLIIKKNIEKLDK